MKIVVDQHLPFVEKAFGSLGELRAVDTTELTPIAVRDADVLIVRSPTRIDETLLGGSKVRFVGTATIGTDHVDLGYLEAREIGFASAPGSNANSVKEYVVAALLRLAASHGISLQGMSIGIVGVGHVGSKVSRAAEALGMNVVLNDPPLARQTGDSRYLPLDELMQADVITLHVPLTKGGSDPTHHLFNANRFDRFKKGTIFINTSRGAVVETSSLKHAVQTGQIGSSVLDVWENEPDIDIELLRRVTLGSPHIAGYSMDGKANAVKMVRDSLCKYFGIDAPWDPSSEFGTLPRQDVTPEKTLSTREGILHDVVSKCYDIAEDDRMLRGMLAADSMDQRAYFTKLRTGYRVRREFSNSIVSMVPQHASLADTLNALGFTVRIEADKVLGTIG